MKVIVGTRNPIKINSVVQAFTKVWPNEVWDVMGSDVKSGVSSQPLSDEETIKGAINRARAALNSIADGEYGVGIEGGLNQINDTWFDCGWVVVVNRDNLEGYGSSARVVTPPKMMSFINQGMELGEVVDQVFGTHNAKQKEGHFGLMTNNIITRESGYVDGVVMALVRFIHPYLF